LAFTGIILLIHLPYLNLPLFWDEMGQFLPAALDLWRHGLWVPQSTRPNVHPPGLAAVLAAVWSLTGYSIVVTRVVMLLIAGGTAVATFLLARRLCHGLPGDPAFSAVILLIVSPLFYTQALLAQLDLPATLLTVWTLYEFLSERVRRAALLGDTGCGFHSPPAPTCTRRGWRPCSPPSGRSQAIPSSSRES